MAPAQNMRDQNKIEGEWRIVLYKRKEEQAIQDIYAALPSTKPMELPTSSKGR